MNKLTFSAVVVAGLGILPAAGSAQTVVTVPDEVETYVVQESVPSVSVEREVVVGSELPDTVVLRPVPKYDTYSYAVVNNRRVVVEAKTRRVIKVLD